MIRIIFLALLLAFSFDGMAQWLGGDDPNNEIYRNGNIKVNGLYFGRYGGPIAGDANPYQISSSVDNEVHDLLLFGNSSATLNLRLYDGHLKFGTSSTPNAILYNNGSATFKGPLAIGTTNLLHFSLNIGSSPTQTPLHLFRQGTMAGEEVILQMFSAPGNSATTSFNVGGIMAKTNGTNSQGSYISIRAINSSGVGWSEGLTVRAGGNVGVGTTNPDAKLARQR